MSLVPYETGRFYKVPCIWARYYHLIGWWPVLGQFHEDAEHIGFSDWHWHVDVRFIPKSRYRALATGGFGCEQRFARSGVLMLHPEKTSAPPKFSPADKPLVFLKRRLCHRQWLPCSETMDKASWMPKLEKAFAQRSLANGHCPHRGADLRSLQPGPDGIVECPLHGLRWRLSDGRLVPRAAKQEAL